MLSVFVSSGRQRGRQTELDTKQQQCTLKDRNDRERGKTRDRQWKDTYLREPRKTEVLLQKQGPRDGGSLVKACQTE